MGCASLDWINVSQLTDTHCHLNLTIFRTDLPEILERARKQGIERILIPGIDLETSQLALELCEHYPNLYAAVGVHPSSATAWEKDTLTILRELCQHPKAIAIGEIGLDYYRDRAPRALQKEILRQQLTLAAEQKKPVVIHNRESFTDLWDELSDWQSELEKNGSPLAQHPGVFHSFDGTLEEALRAAGKGFFIGVSGPVTFRNAEQRHYLVSQLPLDFILLETDAPYLTPHPFRGQRNEPAYVALVAEKVAQLHSTTTIEVVQNTWRNANMLFQWGANP